MLEKAPSNLITRPYISGPMTGLPGYNLKTFNDLADLLRAKGYTVFNPAEIANGDTTKPRRFYMRNAFELVLKANCLIMLPGWQNSKGALIEVAMAYELDYPIYDLDWNELPRNMVAVILETFYSDSPKDPFEKELKEFEKAVEDFVDDIPVESEESLCQEADRIVSVDRQHQYGHPKEDFTRTGKLWAPILGVEEVTPEQVALCMIAVKISRLCNKVKRDSIVDIIGYAKTFGMVVDIY